MVASIVFVVQKRLLSLRSNEINGAKRLGSPPLKIDRDGLSSLGPSVHLGPAHSGPPVETGAIPNPLQPPEVPE